MAYEGGYTSAVNSASNRGVQDVQRQAQMQQMVQMALAFQQQQAQARKQQQARAMLGNLLPELGQLGKPPDAGAQPPMPGQSSAPPAPPGAAAGPMMAAPGAIPPPPPGPASPPPAAAAPPGGGAAPMPQGAGSGAPKPGNGPPGDAASSAPPPQGWRPLPAPPGPSTQADAAIAPPPEEAVMPRQAMSVVDVAKLLASRGIKGEEALDMIEQWKPFMDSQNKTELDNLKVKYQAQAAAMKAYQQVVRDAETRRHHGVLEKQGDARLGQSQQRINVTVGGAGESDLEKDPDTRRFMAEQYWSGDHSVMQNLGRGAQGAKNITALRKEIVKVGKEKGMDAKDLAAATAEFQGIKAGERTLGTRTANVEMAVTEAQNMAQIVLDTSKKFSRTNFTPVNKALKAFQDNTGNTETRQFGAAVNSFINAYSRAISPSGVPTVHDKEHAREMLSTADSDEQVQAVMKTLSQEMDAARKAPRQVKESMREDFTGRGKSQSQLGAPKKGDLVNGYEYLGGPTDDPKSWRKAA